MNAIGVPGAAEGVDIDGYHMFRFGHEYGQTPPANPVTTNYFRGLRLHSDSSFSVTIHERGIPFVFDFLYQHWTPTPFHHWNRGGQMTITDTANGVRIDGMTPELLDVIVNTPTFGIRWDPGVTAGPYLIRSFDPGTGNAVLDYNPNFRGSFDGFVPRIATIALSNQPNATIMDALRVGEIDMVHAQRTGWQIQAGWDFVNEVGTHRGADFPRNGYGYMAWHGDHGPSAFGEVRRAISWMLDRDEFAITFTGGWGTVQQGPYALSGWEFALMGDTLYNHPDFTHYTLNPANAVRELEAGGWVLDAQGNPYVSGWRYKDITGLDNWMGENLAEASAYASHIVELADGRQLMRLQLIWAANDNTVSDIMRVVLPPVAASVGMNIIEQLYVPPTSNIPAWQRSGELYGEGGPHFRAHHIYTLAVGLATPNQFWNSHSLHPHRLAPGFNTTFHGDWVMHDIGYEARAIDASQEGWLDDFLELWLQFQLRYNYWMPLLPLYADDDHDFVPLWLQNWDSHGVWDFRHAVQRAYIAR
jgi:peptide/nickel transport system substrate-binding protein